MVFHSRAACANLDLTDQIKRGGQRSDQLSGWSIEWIRDMILDDLTDISVLQMVNMHKLLLSEEVNLTYRQKCNQCPYNSTVSSLYYCCKITPRFSVCMCQCVIQFMFSLVILICNNFTSLSVSQAKSPAANVLLEMAWEVTLLTSGSDLNLRWVCSSSCLKLRCICWAV